MDDSDADLGEDTDESQSIITVPELSEFEMRQQVAEHRAEYDAFIEDALRADTLLATCIRLQERDSEFVVDALVHQLLTCPPDEREIFRDLAIGIDGRSDLAVARLTAAALDSTLDWDLRVNCFILEVFCNPVALAVKRMDPTWATLPEDEWTRLIGDYHREVVMKLDGTVASLSTAALHFSEEDWAEVLGEFRRRGVEVDWRAVLHEERLRVLWPTAVDELAVVGARDTIPRIKEIVAWFRGDEQARMRRALMRLNAVGD